MHAARHALGREDVQIVAEDVEGHGKRYAPCLWRALFDYYRTKKPVKRHLYAVVMEARHNAHGFPLVIDIDGKNAGDAGCSRAAVLAELRRIVNVIQVWIAVLASDRSPWLQRLVPSADVLVDDTCAPDGQAQSAHLMCRRVGFRTTEAARAFSQQHFASPWLDRGIPKNNGLFKLPGNRKAQPGGRVQVWAAPSLLAI